MTKIDLHHKDKKEMFRCPHCRKDSEYSKWTKVKGKEGYSRCTKCKKEVKDTLVKKVKS